MRKDFDYDLSTPSSLSKDMVENRNEFDCIVEGVRNVRMYRLRKANIEEDILAMELQKGWKNLSEEDKIQHAISGAEFSIMRWHVKLMESVNAPQSFANWKMMLKEQFECIEMSEGQYARISQGFGEKLSDYIIKMEDLGEKLGIEEKRRFSYLLEGIQRRDVVMKSHIVFEGRITPALLKKLKMIEKDFYMENLVKPVCEKNRQKRKILCFICEGNHFAASCPDHPFKGRQIKGRSKPKEVNEIDEDVRNFALNKSDSIYVDGTKVSVVLDTGAKENYISQEMAIKFGSRIIPLQTQQFRYTVDNRKIVISSQVDLDFYHDRRAARATFYILPGTRKDKILLGRDWIKKQLERAKYECVINTMPGRRIIEPTWALPQKLKNGTDKAIEEYERKGYIRDSQSTWSNNIRPVMKPDGSVRIATNLVALNKIVELDKYSLPNMEEIIFSLHGQKWFSKIDLKDGFFQIPLREEDKHKTAFRHGHKLKEWNVMPMGFKNAPAIFQRFMDNVLRKELGKSCWCYVDDILIFGKTEEEHDLGLERIKRILKIHGLEVNETKSVYKKNEMEFLGHYLKENEVQKQVDNEEAIKEYPIPRNRTQIQSFLGLVNYYRKFIKNVTNMCLPLFELLRKEKEFIWGERQQESFESLKKALIEPAILRQPDYSKIFILETDASNTGLGAILTQEFDGVEFPIAYASRMLVGAELNYSISEKECLGAIYGMEKFKYHLYGREFILRTDHKALEKLNRGPLKSARIERWCERLQNFSFTVEYRKGDLIPHVDALSRMHQDSKEINMITEEKEKIFIKTHEDMIHRGAKAVAYRLNQKGIDCTESQVASAIKNCLVCKAYNPKRNKGYKFINSFERGEKVGFDIIGPLKGQYIATAIDYFTREGFAKRIISREAEHVLKFLKDVNENLKIKTLISDGAKENCDKIIKNWAIENKIKHHITSAHHPESNGRIERFNKTILDGIRKCGIKGQLQNRIKYILDQYHETFHEGLGMTPTEAKNLKNWDALRKKQITETINKYQSRFKSGEWDKLEINEDVLVRKEVSRKKDEPLFEEKGTVVEILENDAYNIRRNNGRIIKRHISQLKGIRI